MLELKTINDKLLYKVMSIPTFSGKEVRMQDFLLKLANTEGYDACVDNKGNVYLTKGELPEGKFYPCITAHIDTVQTLQIPYVDKNMPLPLLTEERDDGTHIIYNKDFGLGGDDKAGIVIALTIMDKLETCKAVFFVEEETGCRGSSECDLSWFKDVGYIIAFDSPECNCASWSCNGERLFDRAFYENYIKELGEQFGLTKFLAHPYTDVAILRMDTSLACMNFGAGYYKYHTPWEYIVAEEMDHAAAMGIYLCSKLGNNEYIIPDNPYFNNEEDEDSEYFWKLFSNN